MQIFKSNLKTKVTFFFIMLFSYAHSQNIDSLNFFSSKVVEAFKNESFESYRKLLISRSESVSELIPIIQKEADSLRPNSKYKAANDEHIKELYGSKRDSMNKLMFKHYLEEGIKGGITNWHKIEFVKFIPSKVSPKSGQRFIIGHILFKFNEISYLFFGVTIIKLAAGYRLNLIHFVVKDIEGIEKSSYE